MLQTEQPAEDSAQPVLRTIPQQLSEAKLELRETKQMLKDAQFVTAALMFVIVMLIIFWIIANLF